jgi:hypothetical protein
MAQAIAGFFDNLDTRKGKRIFMPRVREVELTNEPVAIEAPESVLRNAKIAFYAERDSFQSAVEMEARKVKIEPIEFYLNLMLDNALKSRYEYAMGKREKVLSAALNMCKAFNPEDRKRYLDELLKGE